MSTILAIATIAYAWCAAHPTTVAIVAYLLADAYLKSRPSVRANSPTEAIANILVAILPRRFPIVSTVAGWLASPGAVANQKALDDSAAKAALRVLPLVAILSLAGCTDVDLAALRDLAGAVGCAVVCLFLLLLVRPGVALWRRHSSSRSVSSVYGKPRRRRFPTRVQMFLVMLVALPGCALSPAARAKVVAIGTVTTLDKACETAADEYDRRADALTDKAIAACRGGGRAVFVACVADQLAPWDRAIRACDAYDHVRGAAGGAISKDFAHVIDEATAALAVIGLKIQP